MRSLQERKYDALRPKSSRKETAHGKLKKENNVKLEKKDKLLLRSKEQSETEFNSQHPQKERKSRKEGILV